MPRAAKHSLAPTAIASGILLAGRERERERERETVRGNLHQMLESFGPFVVPDIFSPVWWKAARAPPPSSYLLIYPSELVKRTHKPFAKISRFTANCWAFITAIRREKLAGRVLGRCLTFNDNPKNWSIAPPIVSHRPRSLANSPRRHRHCEIHFARFSRTGILSPTYFRRTCTKDY